MFAMVVLWLPLIAETPIDSTRDGLAWPGLLCSAALPALAHLPLCQPSLATYPAHSCLQVVSCSQGAVNIKQLFGEQAQALVSKLNIEGQHRWVLIGCVLVGFYLDG